MNNRCKQIISDSPSEDKGFNRKHSQTLGGKRAYERGEKPISYWTKQSIIEELAKTLDELKLNPKYRKFIATMNMTQQEIIQEVAENKTDLLKRELLEFRGVHYTGNYFQYTRFYGFVKSEKLLTRICGKLAKPRETTQLKLL